MAFKKGFQDLIKFVVFIFLIFLKNLVQDYLYQNWGVAGWGTGNSGLFFASFETFDWILFWFYFRNSLDSTWKIVLMLIVTVFFTTIPDFLSRPLISYDHDNLAAKSVLYFVPFVIFLFLKRSPGQIFLPVMMAFIPLVNLEIANGFSGNLSFLKVFFSNEFLVVNAGPGIFLDLGLAMVKSFFWAGFAILFYEISHQFFVLRSWRLNVEMPLKKGYLLLIFIVFKTLIYWFLGSLIIAILGNNILPLFTNKIGLFLTSAGILGYLIICTLYFRKYMTMYFYDKCGHSNWLYPFFFLPFVDVLALAILLIFPVRHIKRFFSFKYKKERLVALVALILVGYAGWSYFQNIRNVPESQAMLKNALLISQVAVPLLSALGIVLSLKSMLIYRALLIFLFLMLPCFYFYIITPDVGSSLRVEQLVGIVSVYLNIGLSVAFLYPVLNFKSFLKLD
jgi:hypothetical protein